MRNVLTKARIYYDTTSFCARATNPHKARKMPKSKQELFNKVVTSLSDRIDNEVPQSGSFVNVVQEFPVKPPFIQGYLTVMPSRKEPTRRILAAAVKHKNSDYVCSRNLKFGKNEDIKNVLKEYEEDFSSLNSTYDILARSLQEHFDEL